VHVALSYAAADDLEQTLAAVGERKDLDAVPKAPRAARRCVGNLSGGRGSAELVRSDQDVSDFGILGMAQSTGSRPRAPG